MLVTRLMVGVVGGGRVRRCEVGRRRRESHIVCMVGRGCGKAVVTRAAK